MPEALQFTIATDKPRYRTDEPIRLQLRLTNRGQEPAVVNARLGLAPSRRSGEVWLDVDGPAQSSALIVNVNIGPPRPANFTTLAPGAAVEKEYELRTYYQLAEPGDYTLRGTYHNKWTGEEIIGQTAWTGQVESAPITIHIEAAGQESKNP
jgi:hypothetical protein